MALYINSLVVETTGSILGQLDMNNNLVSNVATPLTDLDAANKLYVDTLVATSTGAETLEQILAVGNTAGIYQIDMSGNNIVNVATPVASGDAANLAYVDSKAATTLAQSITYTNSATASLKTYVDNNDFWNKTGTTLTPRTSGNSVSIDTSGTTYAPLTVVPQTATPTTGLVAGALMVRNGILWLYDTTRAKWLSVADQMLGFSRSGNSDGVVIPYSGSANNTLSGPRFLYNGTVVGVSAQSSGGLATKLFLVKKNNAAFFSFSLVGGVYSDSTASFDFAAGDYLSVEADAAGAASVNPVIVLWAKWRI